MNDVDGDEVRGLYFVYRWQFRFDFSGKWHICLPLHRLNIISYVDKIVIDQGGPIYDSHKKKTNSRCLQIPSET